MVFNNINKLLKFKLLAVIALTTIFVAGWGTPSRADVEKTPSVAEVKAFLSLQTDQIQSKAKSCKNSQEFVKYLRVKAPQIIAFKYMSLWILGKNKSKFSNPQLKEFCNIFSQKLIDFYGNILYQYRNANLSLKDVEQIGVNNYRAKFLVPLDQQTVDLEWTVKFSAKDSKLLITDMLVNGISFLQTKRFEYATLMVQYNNDVESFLKGLKNSKPSAVAKAESKKV